MNTLGFEVAQPEHNKDAWRRYVLLGQEAFDYLARNLNERADEPAEAARLATEAFNYAMRQQGLLLRPYEYGRKRKFISIGNRKRAVISLSPGQTLVIKSKPY